jgi:hypothetical protein
MTTVGSRNSLGMLAFSGVRHDVMSTRRNEGPEHDARRGAPSLRLPAKGSVRVSRGPKTAFTPPTYSPPPQSQRINDAVADAMEAKNQLDKARGKIDEQLVNDNNLRGELQALAEQNQRLQDQVNTALAMAVVSPEASRN